MPEWQLLWANAVGNARPRRVLRRGKAQMTAPAERIGKCIDADFTCTPPLRGRQMPADAQRGP